MDLLEETRYQGRILKACKKRMIKNGAQRLLCPIFLWKTEHDSDIIYAVKVKGKKAFYTGKNGGEE